MSRATAYKNLPLPRVELEISPTSQNGRGYKQVKVIARNPTGEAKLMMEQVVNMVTESMEEEAKEIAAFLGWPLFEVRLVKRTTTSRVVEGRIS